MNEDERDDIFDRLPDDFPISESDEIEPTIRLKGIWADALGHPKNERGHCIPCGRGQTCIFEAFYEAMIHSVVRELDKLHLLVGPPKPEIPLKELAAKIREDEEALNDPFNLWGAHPSYRCFMTRHRECEPEGAERGCTCSCGHQEPVCVCSSRTQGPDGIVHAYGCPVST